MKCNVLPPCLVAFLFLGSPFGCSTDPESNRSGGTSDNSAALASLNRQIEDFNANRGPNMGVRPFEQRVSRIEYDPKLDQVTSFDQNDKTFLVLKREPDGRLKGIVEVPYHELVGSGPDGSHSWGHVMAEFYLEKGMF